VTHTYLTAKNLLLSLCRAVNSATLSEPDRDAGPSRYTVMFCFGCATLCDNRTCNVVGGRGAPSDSMDTLMHGYTG
jgi:hypothetical protein